MIDERIDMLDLINFWLAEPIADTDICENEYTFARLCKANRIKDTRVMQSIAHIYAIHVALECLRDSVGNGWCPKDDSYNIITIINEKSVVKYYRIIVHEKKILIKKHVKKYKWLEDWYRLRYINMKI